MTSLTDRAKEIAETYSDPASGIRVDYLARGEFRVDVETFSNQFHAGDPDEWEGSVAAMIDELLSQRNR